MVRVGIIGATGYGGRELARLLAAHPEAMLVKAGSTSHAGEPLSAVLPNLAGLVDVTLDPVDAPAFARDCDVVFLGVPGTESMAIAKALRTEGARVIDMGPDFRLRDTEAFHEYYKTDHTAPELLGEAVYGLPPFYREVLKSAQLVAVPGCYPVSAIVPLRPLLAQATPTVPVVVDAVSGVSGAGRGLAQHFHFSEMNENAWAYKVARHQHTPEIEQETGNVAKIQFTPHVGPYTRGILSTITVRFEEKVDVESICRVYDDEPFVRVLGEGGIPTLSNVRGSNFCDFGWVSDARTGNLILVSAVDNLVGGTAGIALQCMNIMFGLDETTGLRLGGLNL